jgi:hypothetical protein
MKVIECIKCANCDLENDCCKVYGSDPKKAVAECASKSFGAYLPNDKRKIDVEVQDGTE